VLSTASIPDRFLPDKRSICHESGGEAADGRSTRCPELDELDGRIMQLEMSARRLRKEARQGLGRRRLGKLERSWPNSRRPAARQPLAAEKDLIQQSGKLKEDQEALRRARIDAAPARRRLPKASELLRYGRVPISNAGALRRRLGSRRSQSQPTGC